MGFLLTIGGWREQLNWQMAAIDDRHIAAVGACVDTNASHQSTPAQRRAVRRLHEQMEAFEAQLQCPICLCAYATPASLPCNHCFCEECIHRALELKQVCPICKAPAKKRSLRHDTMIQQLQQAAELWVSVACAVTMEEEPEEPKAPTPIRINRLKLAAQTQEASTSSAEASTDTQSRRRKRRTTRVDTISSEEDVPMITPTVTKRATAGPVAHHENGNNAEELETKAPTPDHVQEPSPAKRLRATATNGREATSGQATHINGHAHPLDSENDSTQSATPTAFAVGDLVEVINRTWRGINKPGGAAWITSVNGNGTYDVKYIIGTGRESNVQDQYILTPSEEIGSLATPGRAVKQHRRKQTKLSTPPSVDLLGGNGFSSVVASKTKRSDLVIVFSGYTNDELAPILPWAEVLGAQVVENWSNFVTHLVAKCATPKEVADTLAEDDHYTGVASSSAAPSRKRSLFKEEMRKRWVKVRSMKYLKALAAGRWIVSEEWLRDSAKQGKRLAEASYEADGHLRAQNVFAACQRSRSMREENLRSSSDEVSPLSVGTRLFADYCFHIYGEFLPPMPPPAELSTLINIGGGKTIHFFDDIANEMDKPANYGRTLVIVSDKLNQQMLRRAAKELTALPQLQGVVNKQVVSYQWLLNSISEAKVRGFN